MGAASLTHLKPSLSLKRSISSGFSTRSACEWLLTDVPSDLTVEVAGHTFSLHKFPLASQSGRIRKLLAQPKGSIIYLSDIPGGAEAFELAAKFCYGVSLEITTSNIAVLRCAASYLEMTEEFGGGSLESLTERYLNEIVIPSIQTSISVLHRCGNLLPAAEDTKIITRCVNSIASNACKEQLNSGLSRLEQCSSTKDINKTQTGPLEWWGKSLTGLNIELFQRVLRAMKSKGLKQDIISKILIDYAHNSLLSLQAPFNTNARIKVDELPKQRLLVEAIVGLLPPPSKRNTVPISFLSALLRTCIVLDAAHTTRMELERRIAMQLDQAVLDDIAIPGNFNDKNLLIFDTDPVQRIFTIFLQLDNEEGEGDRLHDGPDSPRSIEQSSSKRVSKLMDDYLTEIAEDPNLSASKFIALAELLPVHARLIHDGLYRAIDIFLKMHPNINEPDRYKLCKIIDCEKLSREACSHAAQNERLPVQMAVQVLYFEQLRLRSALHEGHDQHLGSILYVHPQRFNSGASVANSPRDNYASVRRENRELKLELTRIRMRLTDLEKDHVSMRNKLVTSNPASKILSSFYRKFGKLNSIFWAKTIKTSNGTTKAPIDTRFLIPKRRKSF